jgi:hypothetical protein
MTFTVTIKTTSGSDTYQATGTGSSEYAAVTNACNTFAWKNMKYPTSVKMITYNFNNQNGCFGIDTDAYQHFNFSVLNLTQAPNTSYRFGGNQSP